MSVTPSKIFNEHNCLVAKEFNLLSSTLFMRWAGGAAKHVLGEGGALPYLSENQIINYYLDPPNWFINALRLNDVLAVSSTQRRRMQSRRQRHIIVIIRSYSITPWRLFPSSDQVLLVQSRSEVARNKQPSSGRWTNEEEVKKKPPFIQH